MFMPPFASEVKTLRETRESQGGSPLREEAGGRMQWVDRKPLLLERRRFIPAPAGNGGYQPTLPGSLKASLMRKTSGSAQLP